jgi:DNA-binding GntR family transcriptional regulator
MQRPVVSGAGQARHTAVVDADQGAGVAVRRGDKPAAPSLVARFRKDLAAGAYYPRERLIESDLAARYETTRAAIREALLQLAAEGYVETERNRGARVRPMSISEAIEIAEVRRPLESLCAARAAELATDAQRARIVELAAAMREAAGKGLISDYLDFNARFHSLIYEMSQHSTATHVLEHFRHRPIDRFIPGVFRHRPPAASVADHEAMAEAIASGHPARAEQVTFEHLTNLIEVLEHYRSVNESG